MDVLWILKNEYNSLRTKSEDFNIKGPEDKFVKNFQDFLMHCSEIVEIESTYIHPELEGKFSSQSTVMHRLGSSLKNVRKHAAQVTQLFEDKKFNPKKEMVKLVPMAEKLQESVLSHLSSSEELMLPKLRESMMTSQREDLGQIILDFKDDRSQRLVEPTKHVAKTFAKK